MTLTFKRMQYGLSALLLVVATVITGITFSPQASAYAGGDGSLGNPWRVATCTQLNQMGYEWTDGEADDSYVLANDINCAGVVFESITFGEVGMPFTGTFDGDGYIINNLTISQNSTYRVGLFGQTNNATITNLTLNNPVISGSHNVGPVVGFAVETTIENTMVTGGTVTGMQSEDGALGGLIGGMRMSTLSLVSSSATVGGYQTFGNGGLVGETYGGSISKAWASGVVSGYENIGGLVGRVNGHNGNETTISESFATGNVTADEYVGGLVGYNDLGIITDSYARGNVTALNRLGGLVGFNNFLFERTYSTGQVSAVSAEDIGGLAGSQGEAEMRYSFWDEQTSTLSWSAAGTGVTTNQMKDIDTFTTNLTEDAWDFDAIWGFKSGYNDGYPCLVWHGGCSGSVVVDDEEDSDGVSKAVEDAAPNSGDGNGDGIADSNQDNVVSLVSPVSNTYVTLAVDDTCTLSEVSIANASSHTSQDAAYEYQSGFVNFTATGCAEDVANVQLYYHGVSPENVIARKYNPVTDTYFTIISASVTAASAPLTGTLVSYTIVDNGELDIDDTEGVIVDPVGIATVPGVPNTGFGVHNNTGYIVATLAAVGLGLLVLLGAALRGRVLATVRSDK